MLPPRPVAVLLSLVVPPAVSLALGPQAVETVDAEIEVVQQRLEELRSLREARVKEVADAQAALEEARDRLVKLVQVLAVRRGSCQPE